MGGKESKTTYSDKDIKKDSNGIGKKKSTKMIPNKFQTMEELQDALRAAGLESSNLIIGVDYTRSNTWTGKTSFHTKW